MSLTLGSKPLWWCHDRQSVRRLILSTVASTVVLPPPTSQKTDCAHPSAHHCLTRVCEKQDKIKMDILHSRTDCGPKILQTLYVCSVNNTSTVTATLGHQSQQLRLKVSNRYFDAQNIGRVGIKPTPGAPQTAGAEKTTGAKPTTGSRADTTSVAAGLNFLGVTTAGEKAVSLLVLLHAAAARGDAVPRPADFILTREAAIGAVLEWWRVIAAHAAVATARDLTSLRGVARAQKASLDAAFAAAQGLLEQPKVKNVTHPQEARRSSRRGELKKTV